MKRFCLLFFLAGCAQNNEEDKNFYLRAQGYIKQISCAWDSKHAMCVCGVAFKDITHLSWGGTMMVAPNHACGKED